MWEEAVSKAVAPVRLRAGMYVCMYASVCARAISVRWVYEWIEVCMCVCVCV